MVEYTFLPSVASTDLARHGKPLSRAAPVSESHSCSWNYSCHGVPLRRSDRYHDPTFSQKQSPTGSEATHLATNSHSTSHNGGIHPTILCSRTEEELDEPSPWHWFGYLHPGSCAVYRGLAGTQARKEEEDPVYAIDSHGKMCSSCCEMNQLTFAASPLARANHCTSWSCTNTPWTDAVRLARCIVCIICISGFLSAFDLFYHGTYQRSPLRQ